MSVWRSICEKKVARIEDLCLATSAVGDSCSLVSYEHNFAHKIQPPMRRLFLLLLALVLPMQMSWAASHFCDDERLVAQAVAAAALGDHDHQAAADDQSDGQAEKIADACCSAAHGCHGLHHLMGHQDLAFLMPASTRMPAPSGAAPPLTKAFASIERPNWLAA